MPSIAPQLTVDDVAKSMEYYERVLGFAKGLAIKGEDGTVGHGEVALGDVTLMFAAANAENAATEQLARGVPKGVGVLLYFNLGDDDIDSFYDRAKGAGAKITDAIDDRYWGDRTFTLEDLDGYVLLFAKHVRDVDFSQMQA
jgi:PhnB protein